MPEMRPAGLKVKQKMITAKINDTEVTAEEGSTVLQVATKYGIYIPSLCYHEGLPAYGACRLCLVEVTQNGRSRLESSCTRPIEQGMEIRTDTAEIREHRKMIMEFLLARCPDSEAVQDMAERAGVTETRFSKLNEECILCGLCVRACRDAIGTSAISFMNRGIKRHVDTPFSINSDVCVGCGSCAGVCPTGMIRVEDRDGKRYLKCFNTELELMACPECGKYFTTRRFYEKNKENFIGPEGLHCLCDECRRRQHASRLKNRPAAGYR
ncbi:MAG: 2Fe-2S iron-sulfur cluster-binding protein [Desulfobacteraceae bacterium]|jgi:NADH dehydrogenase/NADH:ubiquinone oxidoreductase subunit G